MTRIGWERIQALRSGASGFLLKDTPRGELFRAIEVICPPGTIGHGVLPAACAARGLTGFRMVDCMYGALAMMLPDKVKAAGDGPLTFGFYFAGSGVPVPGAPVASITNLMLPPFRVIGAVQDPELDRYGLGISYLFNRPPDKASAETAGSYVVRSSFHGQDTASPANVVDRVALKTGAVVVPVAKSSRSCRRLWRSSRRRRRRSAGRSARA